MNGGLWTFLGLTGVYEAGTGLNDREVSVRHALVLLGAVLLLPPAFSQEPARLPHDSSNPWKCKACQKPLAAAYEFLEKQGAGADGYAQFFLGWLYLADNLHPKELDRAASRLSAGFYKQGGFNGNWATCMSAVFLAEVYRRQPTEKLRGTLLEVLKVAEANMEPTGGWCHHKGFAVESGYNKRGGGVDLGILTSMMYGAMVSMKKSGVPVPERMLYAAERNLESLSDGQGVCYGTDNKVPDTAMGRAAWMWPGLHAAKHTGSKFYARIPKGLASRCKNTDQGHAFPPLHFMSVALAMHLLGPETYSKFSGHWIDRLIALQKADGSIELPHTEGVPFQRQHNYVPSTATFALILVLQQPGALERSAPQAKKKPQGAIFPVKEEPKLDPKP